MSRLRLQAEFAWRHGSHPMVRMAHRWWDVRLRRRFPAVVSYAESGELTVAYGGVEHGLTTTLTTLEAQREPIAGATRSRTAVRAGWADLLAAGRDGGADLVAIGASAARLAGLPTRAALVLPLRVRLTAATDGGAEAVRRRISRRAREQFAHDRRPRGWSLVRDDTDGGFDLFYERMHLPTMARRHGERTRSEGRDAAYACLFRPGHLLFVVEDGGERVAGTLCGWDARTGTLTLRLLGVLDGDEAHYASGAFKAVYHLLLEWAAEHGAARVDFANADPFLAQGVVQWKQRFHPTISLPASHLGDKRLWLHAARDSAAVRDFLVANPLVAMAPGGGLEAVRFFDAERPARMGVPADYDGVGGSRCVDLDEFLGSRDQRSQTATLRSAP